MSEMQRMFEGVISLAQVRGELQEALLYKGGTFSKVEYERDGVTYVVSIVKEDKEDA